MMKKVRIVLYAKQPAYVKKLETPEINLWKRVKTHSNTAVNAEFTQAGSELSNLLKKIVFKSFLFLT